MMLFRHEVGWLLLKYCTQLCAVGSCVLESARKLKSVLDRPNAKSDVFFLIFQGKLCDCDLFICLKAEIIS